jgi:hypothetical protein
MARAVDTPDVAAARSFALLRRRLASFVSLRAPPFAGRGAAAFLVPILRTLFFIASPFCGANLSRH